jgi:mRNA interferase HicA
MKRLDLIRHLERNGCALLREDRRHSVCVNRTSGSLPTVPRHREIARFAVALAGAVLLIFILGKLGIFRKK